MFVDEVFDVFKEYPDDPDDHNIWVGLISTANRAGYLCIDGEKHPAFEDVFDQATPKEHVKELLNKDVSIITELTSFHNRPHIEDASFAMQKTLEAAKEMESMMLFVGEDDCLVWKDHSLSRQEYERQMDADIEKFCLSKTIVKNEEDCLYVCYQDFLCSFTEKGREKVREAVPVESEPVKALISTDEATLGKIKEQFGVEVQYTDKTAFLLEPFHHSNILEEIDYLANSLYDDSKYGEAVLNDDKRRKELFNEVCFRLDRAVSADDDGLNWAQAREVIEQCFRHEKEKFDHPVRKAAVR
ncbi:MAG: hypothetical protein IKW79_07370 [Schwartzia sp.]|nr:hypothetical protein [Schwartzia sp. (in: firmicutes)]